MPDILALRISSGYGLNGQLRPAPPVATPRTWHEAGATKSRRGDPQDVLTILPTFLIAIRHPTGS
jgi:hypothetical protein